ncbi:DeoR family transcriptional regulator [Streptomyces sp. NPDC056105]|uniref:DeoR family transcriptional regulator n=1 Tax=Streptomyces sp. NPDC056105 TaxID=3345714 RepID=UPI0035E1EBA9
MGVGADPVSSPLRQEAILREVRRSGSVNVTRIAAELGVSVMTVRRDIAVLAHHGLVTRVYGGAIPPRTKPAPRGNVPPVPGRSRTFVLGNRRRPDGAVVSVVSAERLHGGAPGRFHCGTGPLRN